jgi:hypothetical protein
MPACRQAGTRNYTDRTTEDWGLELEGVQSAHKRAGKRKDVGLTLDCELLPVDWLAYD